MLSKIKTMGLMGIDGYVVIVETDISNGIPSFDMVGLGDTAVKESKERVRAAIKNCKSRTCRQEKGRFCFCPGGIDSNGTDK